MIASVLLFLLSSNVVSSTLGSPGSLVSPRPTEWGVYDLQKKGDHANIAINEAGDDLKIFCHKAAPASIASFWASASMKLDSENLDYQVYLAPNVSAVNELVRASETAWFYSQLPWRSKEFKFSPFEDMCVGVMTSHQYRVTLVLKSVNYMMLFATVFGITFFWMAPKLCRNTFFHYTTGISAGVVLSLLILTYLIQKKMKVNFMSWMTIAYSLSLYFITKTWYNIKEYLTDQYFHWLVGYLLLAGVVSFAVMYRMGPPDNPRTLNLIQWSMQLVGLSCIVFSSYHQPASMLLAILLLLWSGIPASWKSAFLTQYRKRFNRPKVRLMTEDEYSSQALVETRKALEELREFCRSPQCSSWKTVSRLASPKRFAEFVEGSPHLTEGEVIEYSQWEEDETDDEDDDRITDDEESNDRPANRSFDSQN